MPDNNVAHAATTRRTRRSKKKEGTDFGSRALPSAKSAADGGGLVGHDRINPLALRTLLMRPSYLAGSDWLEHIPFAFWLVEAHRPRMLVELGAQLGTSYFAFCQAVERLGLDTHCFAVDTWTGDGHAGFYGEGVFEDVSAYNTANYSRFSRLVRSTFDGALEHFSDGSIDLLHIDGFHTLEAVKHDFESWLPKLSKRAVVLLHDSNVRERQFGVFKLVEELRGAYPVFEFPHGYGLAVIGVGQEQNDVLRRLFEANEEESARLAVHEVFSRLGRGCADGYSAEHQRKRLQALEETHKGELERLKADQHAGEFGQLFERVKLLEELRADVKDEVARLNARVEHAAQELKERTDSLLKLQIADVERQQLLMQEQQEAQRQKESAEAAREEIVSQRAELMAKEAAHAAVAEKLKLAEELRDEMQEEVTRLNAWAERAAEELKQRSDTVFELQREADHSQQLLAEAKQNEQRHKEDAEAVREELERLLAERDSLKAERQALSIKSRKQVAELATLTDLCRQRETEADLMRQTFLSSMKVFFDSFPRVPATNRSLKALSEQLKGAGIVDSKWYLDTYTDVAAAALDPAVHYILHGLKEGRVPRQIKNRKTPMGQKRTARQ